MLSRSGTVALGLLLSGLLFGCASKSSHKITFTLRNAPGNPNSYCSRGEENAYSCNLVPWLTISGATDGREYDVFAPACTPSCDNCLHQDCSFLCVALYPLQDAGLQTTWQGSYYQAGTCGAGSCFNSFSLPSGSYYATMCAYRVVPDGGDACAAAESLPTCIKLPFNWPPADDGLQLVGTLDAVDGGG